jgi:hypothetical protein
VRGNKPIDPDSVRRYLEDKFGEDLGSGSQGHDEARQGVPAGELAEQAYRLYERFRPFVPEGRKGWGARGELDLGVIEGLARRKKQTEGTR